MPSQQRGRESCHRTVAEYCTPSAQSENISGQCGINESNKLRCCIEKIPGYLNRRLLGTPSEPDPKWKKIQI